ncbi:MAG TPA: hypothetical protein DCP90_07720 [Clostridiales bacterium]|nr:MAG: hypothetical protein A2Y22_01285 [Clostridiales bacterium GWD2_32_59]HAN10486.1 hypothetical protein [Clostridiales bacterium]
MQGIQQVYTKHNNKKNKRTGHVFQQRYKAIVCNKVYSERYKIEVKNAELKNNHGYDRATACGELGIILAYLIL